MNIPKPTEERYGRYVIVYSSILKTATVTEQGILFRVAVHEEADPKAVEKCKAWIDAKTS
jgi:hypothetical protein